jgi:DMSO/TMAO reductase YedYZ heme-binding membrane subunit
MNPSDRTRWMLLLLACLTVSLVCVVYPIYVIRPFRAQGARELAAALVVSRFRPLVTLVSAIAALVAAVGYWQVQASNWRRALAVTGAAFVCLLAYLARVNVYELMFHPVDHPAFASVSEVKLDKDDKLIVVKAGGVARAYPIRTMGYHHIVNDVVGGMALVSTY